MSLANQASRFRTPKPEPLSRSERHHATMQQLERLSTWLDASIPVPGTSFRFGWDTVIGFVPGVGDVTTAAMSGWIVWQAKRMGVSRWALARMIANVGIDTLLGSVPVFGDLFDATYKSNQRNIALLRQHLERHTVGGEQRSPRAAVGTSELSGAASKALLS